MHSSSYHDLVICKRTVNLKVGSIITNLTQNTLNTVRVFNDESKTSSNVISKSNKDNIGLLCGSLRDQGVHSQNFVGSVTRELFNLSTLLVKLS